MKKTANNNSGSKQCSKINKSGCTAQNLKCQNVTFIDSDVSLVPFNSLCYVSCLLRVIVYVCKSVFVCTRISFTRFCVYFCVCVTNGRKSQYNDYNDNDDDDVIVRYSNTHTHTPDMVGAFPGLMFSHAHTHASEYVYMGHVGPLFWTRWGTDLLRENDPLEGGPQEGAAVDFFL